MSDIDQNFSNREGGKLLERGCALGGIMRLVNIATLLGLLTCFFAAQAAATDFTIIHAFAGGRDGAAPQAGLSPNGSRLLGTNAGKNNDTQGKHCSKSCGNNDLYSLKGDRKRILYRLPDDEAPTSAVLVGLDGSFYGASRFGGTNRVGTIFKVASDGSTKTDLHTFCSDCGDGTFPVGDLFADAKGNIYGATESGGTGAYCEGPGGCGTIYMVSATGSYSVIYSFCSMPNCADGAQPEAGLIADEAGKFYGTTLLGGDAGEGTIFVLSADGMRETVLHSFSGGQADGAVPFAPLLMDPTGKTLYGTTSGGGNFLGTVFSYSLDSQIFKLLYAFKGKRFEFSKDGRFPEAGLVMDGVGNLYGTTSMGGLGQCFADDDPFGKGCGTIFKLTPDGKEVRLHVFQAGNDGAYPRGKLVLQDDRLLGVTAQGGGGPCYNIDDIQIGCGTIFAAGAH